jgi:hypothetical protein
MFVHAELTQTISMTILGTVSCDARYVTATFLFTNVIIGQKRYYGVHYPRLQDLKAKYDPANMFLLPLGIEPKNTAI